MSIIRRKFTRAKNWTKRRLGLQAHWVDHVNLSVALADGVYSVKSSVKNLTGSSAYVKAEAFVSDSAGLLSFENLLSVNLLTSEQLFCSKRTDGALVNCEAAVLAPFDEVNFELAEVDASTGLITIPHKFGTSDPLSGTCKLMVKIYGVGQPHIFNVSLTKATSDEGLVLVRQQASLNVGSQLLGLRIGEEVNPST